MPPIFSPGHPYVPGAGNADPFRALLAFLANGLIGAAGDIGGQYSDAYRQGLAYSRGQESLGTLVRGRSVPGAPSIGIIGPGGESPLHGFTEPYSLPRAMAAHQVVLREGLQPPFDRILGSNGYEAELTPSAAAMRARQRAQAQQHMLGTAQRNPLAPASRPNPKAPLQRQRLIDIQTARTLKAQQAARDNRTREQLGQHFGILRPQTKGYPMKYIPKESRPTGDSEYSFQASDQYAHEVAKQHLARHFGDDPRAGGNTPHDAQRTMMRKILQSRGRVAPINFHKYHN